MFKIIPIPAFKDNYIWAIVHPNRRECLIVDPGTADPVFQFLEQQQLHLAGILITHHHADHTGGILELTHKLKVPVYGSKKDVIPCCNRFVCNGDILSFPTFDIKFDVLEIPAHTHGHLAYFGQGIAFTGDTLFTGGCGRVFEGTYEQMFHSLQKLAALPEETLIYCGHEYTQNNLKFAALVEPNNIALQKRIRITENLRAQNHPTVPATLGLELQTNPFLRCHIPSVIAAAERYAQQKLPDNIAVFTVLRNWKNQV